LCLPMARMEAPYLQFISISSQKAPICIKKSLKILPKGTRHFLHFRRQSTGKLWTLGKKRTAFPPLRYRILLESVPTFADNVSGHPGSCGKKGQHSALYVTRTGHKFCIILQAMYQETLHPGEKTGSIPPSMLPVPVTSFTEFCRQCTRKSGIPGKNGQHPVLSTAGTCCQSCRQCTSKSQTLGEKRAAFRPPCAHKIKKQGREHEDTGPGN